MRMHCVWLLLACVASASAWAQTHAQRDASIAVAPCVEPTDGGAGRGDAACPEFLVEPVRGAREICSADGGKLGALAQPEVWTVDVNVDGTREYAFELNDIVSCEGAWSVFSCGSLGCPKGIYQHVDGVWRQIAVIWASTPRMLQVLDEPIGQSYKDLRVGCDDGVAESRCCEYWYSPWRGTQYERSHLDVRGLRVEFADSVHGLYDVVGEIDVLAEPAPGAAVLGHYGADTLVAIVGTATGADYYYVSPCNACDSGFVPRSAVRASQ
jgi:hypothetical protein